MQGRLYTGGMYVNSAALMDSVNGEVVFILKVEDTTSMSRDQADAIAQLIHAADPHLQVAKRGRKAAIVRVFMKCALERHSCCHGDFGLSKAEQQSPEVHKKVLRILATACSSLQKAFPSIMLGIYARSVRIDVYSGQATQLNATSMCACAARQSVQA